MIAKLSTTVPAILAISALVLLSACASHRSKPPTCDGPYSPINITSAELAHDAKR